MSMLEVPKDNYMIDLTIARGLDYYTGTVYETILDDYKSIGSISSGGRYDSLAEYYTDKKLPGVGISIGLTRLFDQLLDANIIKVEQKTDLDVLILPMSDNIEYILNTMKKLRNDNIKVDVCDLSKNTKQYANRINVKYVVIIGDDEIKTNTITLKNMETGEQKNISVAEVKKSLI